MDRVRKPGWVVLEKNKNTNYMEVRFPAVRKRKQTIKIAAELHWFSVNQQYDQDLFIGVQMSRRW